MNNFISKKYLYDFFFDNYKAILTKKTYFFQLLPVSQVLAKFLKPQAYLTKTK